MPAALLVTCRDLERSLPSLLPPLELGGLATEVARLLAPVRQIVLAPLPNEDKVQLRGHVLTVEKTYPLMLGAIGDPERRLRPFALYVAHEVAHIAQGISDKTRVMELHAAEGEAELLWIDAEADHAAARYCRAVLGADLVTHKRAQLEALRAFPVSLDHRPADRLRKVRRAVDLAIDIEARVLDLLDPTEIAQLRWPRGGGTATVFVQGSYRRCLHTAKVSGRQTQILERAANPPRRSRLTTLLKTAREILTSDRRPLASGSDRRSSSRP